MRSLQLAQGGQARGGDEDDSLRRRIEAKRRRRTGRGDRQIKIQVLRMVGKGYQVKRQGYLLLEQMVDRERQEGN